MNYYETVQRALHTYNLRAFKNALKSGPLDEFFIEKYGYMSLWHLTCYEPVDQRFLQAVFECAQKQNLEIPIDITDHKGRTAYALCTVFGMTDKMQWLADHGADVTLGDRRATPLALARYFFGNTSTSPDPSIEDLVVQHTAAQQKRTLSAAVPQKSGTPVGLKKI